MLYTVFLIFFMEVLGNSVYEIKYIITGYFCRFRKVQCPLKIIINIVNDLCDFHDLYTSLSVTFVMYINGAK